MILCPDYKLAFIHIYKTGGSSLTRTLSGFTQDGLRGPETPTFQGDGWQATWHFNGMQHAKFSEIENKVSAIVDRDWSYIVVCRDPYDWFASVFYEFYYIDRSWLKGSNFLFGRYSKNRSFEDFIDFYNDFKAGYPHFWGFSTQFSFVRGIPLDQLKVIKFENYEVNARSVLEQLGIPVPGMYHELQKGTEKRDFTTFIKQHPKFIEFVAEIFEEDFAFFDYTTENF